MAIENINGVWWSSVFKVNNYVMYGKIGICLITGIRDGSCIGKPESKYYVLRPVFSGDLEIMSPVQDLKAPMRELASKQEVFALIQSIPIKDSVWEKDSKLRNTKFTMAMNSGRCEEWIVVIKSINEKFEEYRQDGKKLSYLDETMLKDAKRLLHEEFSYPLNLRPDEVESYIQKQISKNRLAS
jgi:RNA polymerase-interacting CarD/CdnL/TRCF family regulator